MEQYKTLPRRVVILTSRQFEYLAVRTHVQVHTSDIEEHTGTVYELGSFASESNEDAWDVILAEIDTGGPDAAVEAERAIRRYAPSLILFVGVAGGLETVHAGDVVVATKVYGYESGVVGEIFKSMPEVGNSSYRMQHRAKYVARMQTWQRRVGQTLPNPLPVAYVGPTAAGEKVLASKRTNLYTSLHEHYNDVLAVELGGHGFLKATHAHPDVYALIIRGIDGLISAKGYNYTQETQNNAARHATAFAFEILASLSNDPIFQKVKLNRQQEQPGEKKEQSPSSKYTNNIRHVGTMIQGDHAHVTNNYGERNRKK